jgi:carboxyl-terminal processing protease
MERMGAAAGLGLAVLLFFGACAPASAETLSGPRPSDRRVVMSVVALLQKEHLTRHPLDDEISARGLENFLKMLDPMKLYFTQGDVAEFLEKYKTQIDDDLKKSDISVAYSVFDRFLKRIDERMATIETLLEKNEFDFTVNEEMLVDRDLLRYPGDAAEAEDRWRKRLKYDLLSLKSEKVEGKEAIERLQRRYRTFAKRMHQTDGDELLEMFLTGIISTLDPHTTYMSPSTLENFRITMGLSLEGIGASLQSVDGITKIMNVIPGGAADKHGKLKEEDQIVSVGEGVDGEMIDVRDEKLDDVVGRIRGKAGTVVRLGVLRPGETETMIFDITRAKVELEDSAARAEIIEVGEGDAKQQIGFINLPSFYMDMKAAQAGNANFRSTTRDVRKILEDFKAKGVDAVVLDLRRNGGGSLTEAINLTGLFIEEGPVVQVKDPGGRIQHYDDEDPAMVWDGPLVVMTSKLSASASEIFAGAIQDYRRGLVVGDLATHGKGTVQSLLDLGSELFQIANPPNLGALKITMQQFYRPNGDSTQKRGVLADISIPSLTTHMDVGEADLDFAVEFDRVPPAKFESFGLVNAETISKLRQSSEERRKENEKFQELAKNIETFREQKERKSISLNEKVFFERQEELDAEKAEEEEILGTEEEKDKNEIVKKDFYFDEVIAITRDYLRALDSSEGKLAQPAGANAAAR